MNIPYVLKSNVKHFTFPSGLAQLTATKTEVEKKDVVPTTSKPLNINEQIEEFFKSGGDITKVNTGVRAISEREWFTDSYPKNKNIKVILKV